MSRVSLASLSRRMASERVSLHALSLVPLSLIFSPSCVSSVSSFLHSRRQLYQKVTAACIKCHQLPSSAARAFLLVLRTPPGSRKGLLFVPTLDVSLPLSLSLSASLSLCLLGQRHQCQIHQCLCLYFLYIVFFLGKHQLSISKALQMLY